MYLLYKIYISKPSNIEFSSLQRKAKAFSMENVGKNEVYVVYLVI